MKEVYYKGQPYRYEMVTLAGNRLFVLYREEGELMHYVREDELDMRTRVSLILQDYYQQLSPQSPVLQH